MAVIPLLIKRAELARPLSQGRGDQTVLDDDLPAVLDRDASGYVLSRDTTLTEVRQETTDET